MPAYFTDTHPIVQPPGKTMTETLYRHLIGDDDAAATGFHAGHGMSEVSWDGTLQDLSRIHAGKHGRPGRTDPENDSATTKRQKAQLAEGLRIEFGVEMPDWFYEHSFLSDLRVFARSVRAAYLARPSTVMQDGVDKSNQA